MKKGNHQESEPLSLLSAFMSSNAHQSPRSESVNLPNKGIRIPRPKDSTSYGGCHANHTDSHQPNENFGSVMGDPPTTLEDQLSSHPQFPLHSLGADVLPLSSRPSELTRRLWPNLNAGSLSKEYDNDTWRMYERIQGSRLNSQAGLYSLVRETVDNMQYSSGGDEASPRDQESSSSLRLSATTALEPEHEEMFDLDL